MYILNEVNNLLNEKEFAVLCYLSENRDKPPQRKIAEALDMSLGSVNKTMKELEEKKLISDNAITVDGIEALEPYRVKRAVFLAAGFGERLVPITLNTPKPLVRVNGTRIIDTLLDAVIKAGIEEIFVVRGYLAEQFDQLLYKYPMIKFIENPIYNEANNISSAMCVRHLFNNSYIFDADLLIYNPDIVQRYQFHSNLLGRKTERTDDWCYITKNGIITEERIGGTDCYLAYGIGYLNYKDGNDLCEHLKTAFEMPGGKELFWEQVITTVFKKEYRIHIRECKKGDLTEIDTFRELKELDKAYDY